MGCGSSSAAQPTHLSLVEKRDGFPSDTVRVPVNPNVTLSTFARELKQTWCRTAQVPNERVCVRLVTPSGHVVSESDLERPLSVTVPSLGDTLHITGEIKEEEAPPTDHFKDGALVSFTIDERYNGRANPWRPDQYIHHK